MNKGYIDRMVEEYQQLTERMSRLYMTLYRQYKENKELDEEEFFLLSLQYTTMQSYSTVLLKRINYAKQKERQI